jgi:hypothetical protein
LGKLVVAGRDGPGVLERVEELSIRRLRLGTGMSQSALGLAAGVTFQQVQKYEKGANRLSVARLAQLLTRFRCRCSRCETNRPTSRNASADLAHRPVSSARPGTSPRGPIVARTRPLRAMAAEAGLAPNHRPPGPPYRPSSTPRRSNTARKAARRDKARRARLPALPARSATGAGPAAGERLAGHQRGGRRARVRADAAAANGGEGLRYFGVS